MGSGDFRRRGRGAFFLAGRERIFLTRREVAFLGTGVCLVTVFFLARAGFFMVLIGFPKTRLGFSLILRQNPYSSTKT